MLTILRRWLARWRQRSVSDDDPFADVAIPIESHAVSADGTSTVVARGEVAGRLVALQVEVGAVWEPWHLEEQDLTLWQGSVTYVSLGAESDALVNGLAALYGRSCSRPMLPRVQFTAIALNGNPLETLAGGAQIKCFFEADADERYAELYTNISLDEAVLEIREKDFEYRRMVIAALTDPVTP